MKSKLNRVAACLLLLSSANSFAAIHYVDANSATPVSPFLTWSTAAARIQDAIDAAAAGDEVVVTNGIYATGGRAVYGTMTNRVVVDKPLFVHSVNGAQFTTIQGRKAAGINGPDAIRCVYVSDGASLSGFTLTKGATHDSGATYLEQSGGGLWCTSASVAVSNCVMAGNSAAYAGGGVYEGSLYNCAIFGNSAGSTGGGALASTLYNCTVAGNSADVYHGGTGFCNLYNSTIYFNSPDNGDFCCYNTVNYCCTAPAPYAG